jgi:2-haloalkanoic acid dehalogenase type II
VAEPMFQANEVQTDRAARLPVLLVFDVNETLSNMAPLSARFEEVGASGQLAGTWFAGLLRDGFALAVGRENPPFASLAAEGLRMQLPMAAIDRDLEEAVDHIMAGFSALRVHPDVPEGLRKLTDLGVRLVTLTNGSTTIAEHLLSEAGVEDCFESFLSVSRPESGSRHARPTPMRSSTAVSRPPTRCWSPPIPGTRTEPGERVWRPRGSTELEGDTPHTFWHPIWTFRRW